MGNATGCLLPFSFTYDHAAEAISTIQEVCADWDLNLFDTDTGLILRR
jgi:hypothetical protein